MLGSLGRRSAGGRSPQQRDSTGPPATAEAACSAEEKAASSLTRSPLIGAMGGMMRAVTFRERMREEAAKAAAAEVTDPWSLRLARVRGKTDFYDGLERISSQTLLDLLEVPQRNRTAGTYRRLCKIMSELGWTAVRVRHLTRGGYREQVRGYCRDARKRQASYYS